MSDFSQPDLPEPPTTGKPRKVKPSDTPMTVQAEIISNLLSEVYWLATSRAGRTQQVQLGPSELGDPCEQKLVRRLIGLTPANHGRNDGWPATVGTAVHAWLADAFHEYDSGRGRFLVEHPVTIPAPESLGDEWAVHGTMDLYDRRTRTLIDHKVLGDVSLDNLRQRGEPDDRYRVQLHVYGYGLELQGERPETVAMAAWPRVEGSLSKLYVWAEPYSPSYARESLERRHRLVSQALTAESYPNLLRETPLTPSSLCRYCPFYSPYATDVMTGCRGVVDVVG